MNRFNVERGEQGYTVYRDHQAIATFARADEAIDAMRQFRERPEGRVKATVPPMIQQMKARLRP